MRCWTCAVGSDDGGEVGHGAECVSAVVALEVVQHHAVDATHGGGAAGTSRGKAVESRKERRERRGMAGDKDTARLVAVSGVGDAGGEVGDDVLVGGSPLLPLECGRGSWRPGSDERGSERSGPVQRTGAPRRSFSLPFSPTSAADQLDCHCDSLSAHRRHVHAQATPPSIVEPAHYHSQHPPAAPSATLPAPIHPRCRSLHPTTPLPR